MRSAGSLSTGAMKDSELMCITQGGDSPSALGKALAEYGRIAKILHMLAFVEADETYRRMITAQLNTSVVRHGLARKIGSLELALSAVVWWNGLYIDTAVDQLRADGFPATKDMCARLSPLICEHINFRGSYTFPNSTCRPDCVHTCSVAVGASS